MRKIYSVVISGKTLESGNLKELLSRAVIVKRNQKPMVATGHYRPLVEKLQGASMTAHSTAMY
jgi:hypothetical protein